MNEMTIALLMIYAIPVVPILVGIVFIALAIKSTQNQQKIADAHSKEMGLPYKKVKPSDNVNQIGGTGLILLIVFVPVLVVLMLTTI